MTATLLRPVGDLRIIISSALGQEDSQNDSMHKRLLKLLYEENDKKRETEEGNRSGNAFEGTSHRDDGRISPVHARVDRKQYTHNTPLADY